MFGGGAYTEAKTLQAWLLRRGWHARAIPHCRERVPAGAGLGVQGSAYPLQAQLHAVRNELTIAIELEHHTRGTT